MSKCVYCMKNDSETTFTGREHVIPQFLGGFEPFNPSIQGDLVCDGCNSEVFSPLESNFKEDSYEGLFGQMLNLGNAGSVRIKGRNLDIDSIAGFGDGFFDEIFPFLKYENDELVVDLKAQVKLKNYADGYQVFTEESLRKIKDGGQVKFNRTKERLRITDSSKIAIFTGSHDGSDAELDSFIEILEDFGIQYDENERQFTPQEEIQETRFELNVEFQINAKLMRVIAKIAFNYFIYCSSFEQDTYKDKLFSDNFNNIRNFIYKGEGSWRDFVTITDNPAILRIEGRGTSRVLAHTIYFTMKEGVIFAYISLFGKFIYKVTLGTSPFRLVVPNFGCGHAFNVPYKTIHAIGPDQFSINRMANTDYGLFKV